MAPSSIINDSYQSGARLGERAGAGDSEACFHCGQPCRAGGPRVGSKAFCCAGCETVWSLLTENGLDQFYRLNERPGQRMDQAGRTGERWRFLDDPAVTAVLLDFANERMAKVTLRVPAIHCVACIWLLENLARLHPAVGQSTVNFPRREVAITFDPKSIRLSELVALLASVGYEPEWTLGDMARRPQSGGRRRQWLQVGLAGFAFGNIMLLALPNYLGLDAFSGPWFQRMAGWVGLALSLPVLVYSASDYWKAAWMALRRRVVTLDVPIAFGLAAIYGQSLVEVVRGQGEGYFDSLTGLIFFLLCGRVFQQLTHDRLAFDRDYRGFFPLSVVRRTAAGEEVVAISSVRVGDVLRLRHGELLPADGRLIQGEACVDYSFVTGEAEPVTRRVGDLLYAGGRQTGGLVEVETTKAVSESYLTSLWNNEAFRKDRDASFETMSNAYSRRFTATVLCVAIGAALYWAQWDGGVALRVFAAVLIVACPCALALAAPLTLGAAQRVLARWGVYLRNGPVLERLAGIDAIVLDKTGTLTSVGLERVRFAGEPLTAAEAAQVWAAARGSTHPHALAITAALAAESVSLEALPTAESFTEVAGQGLVAQVNGARVLLGSGGWLQQHGIGDRPVPRSGAQSKTELAVDGRFRGAFEFGHELRPAMQRAVESWRDRYRLALLSGDQPREVERLRAWFGADAELQFEQSPFAKLGYVRALRNSGRRVLMIGDGLNDAGALQESDVGIAVVDDIGAFSPASDVIVRGSDLGRLPDVLILARRATRVIRFGFVISGLYNVVGIAIAAAGLLSPIVCAVLMPVSSASVVMFTLGATAWLARRTESAGAGRSGGMEAPMDAVPVAA